VLKKKLRRAIVTSGVLAAAVGTATAMPASAAGPWDSTTTTRFVLRHSGKAMTVNDWWKSDPVGVDQQSYQGFGTQKFKFRYFDDGLVSLIDTSWWQGCLDVQGNSLQPGAKIVSQGCDGTASQKWTFDRDAGNLNYVYLRNANSGLVVTLEKSGTTSGIKFVQRAKTGSTLQQFSKDFLG